MGQRIRKLYSFPIDADLADGLKRLKARDGVPEAETIRRALRHALERAGVLRKTGRQRAATRKRP